MAVAKFIVCAAMGTGDGRADAVAAAEGRAQRLGPPEAGGTAAP